MKKIAITLALCAINVLADSSVINISPVSVTATGVEESVLNQALSIATKDKEEIKLDQVIFQKDLLNSLAGVRIEQTGSVIGHQTAIRMPNSTGSFYLFMQDGIPVQSSGFFNHNGLAYTTFQSASSVEVLKGAGTALYGSDAVAAVINVESSAKPSKEQEITVKGMLGSDGYKSASVSMSDTIDETSGYRANVSVMKNDGWRDHSEAQRFEANLRYDKVLNDDNDIKIIFNTSVTDAEQADSFSDYANIENGSSAASDDAAYFTALEKTEVKRQFDYARLSVEWNNYSFKNLEISTTPYVRYNRNQYVATWEKNMPSNDNEIMTVGLLQRNTLDTSWGRLIAGFDTEYTQSSLKYNQDFDHTVAGWGGATYVEGALYDYDVNYMAFAPYIHSEIDITKSLMLTAGLRYDYNHYEYKNNLASNSTDASGVYYRPADRSDSFSHLSPKLSLSYKPREDMNMYVRYANGFMIPQASRLYSQKDNAKDINLDAQTSNTYEIGIKKAFANKSYTELAIYYMTIDDTITKYDVTGADSYYANGGSTIHKGIEFTGQVQMTNDWAARLAYSYSKHNYENDDTYGNNEMSQAPNHLANARLIYTPSALKGLRIMAEVQKVGSYWMDDSHNNKYGGYTIGNIKSDYAFSKNFNIFAKLTNITDERYAVSASAGWGNSYTPGDPRQLYAGAEYKW
ncbi:MAG: TonB-dependent receptor [Sulfurimonas sp.]|nr:TonB-dependent receptor [Sulfurimonas sp.]